MINAHPKLIAVFRDGITALLEGVVNAPIMTPEEVVEGLEKVRQLPAAMGGDRTSLSFGRTSKCVLHYHPLRLPSAAPSLMPKDLGAFPESGIQTGRRRFATAAPHGSLRPFELGQSSNPYPLHYRAAFAFSAFSYPLPQQLPSQVACHRFHALKHSHFLYGVMTSIQPRHIVGCLFLIRVARSSNSLTRLRPGVTDGEQSISAVVRRDT
jgi:hypothetical protein